MYDIVQRSCTLIGMSVGRELSKIPRVPWRLSKRVLPCATLPSAVKWGKKLFNTKFILIACMPKSGSTFLTTSLGGLPGFRTGSAVPVYGRREQELDEWSLIRSSELSKNTVYQHHVCYSEGVERFLVRYPFHVVVLCRDLRDIVASISDHYDNESIVGPFAYLDKDCLHRLDREGERVNFIVDMVLPWYVKFYVSWKKYQSSGGNVQFLIYEEVMKDKIGAIKSILMHAGLDAAERAIVESLGADRPTRFNKGISGRGKSLFQDNPRADEILQRYLSYYPEIDFSPVLVSSESPT